MAPTKEEEEWLHTATYVLGSIIRNRENMNSLLQGTMVNTAARMTNELLAKRAEKFPHTGGTTPYSANVKEERGIRNL